MKRLIETDHQSYNSKVDRCLHFEQGPTHIFQMQSLLFLLIHWSWMSFITVTDPVVKLRATFCRNENYGRFLCTLHIVEFFNFSDVFADVNKRCIFVFF